MFPHASGRSGTQNNYSSHLHSDHFDDSKKLENIKKFDNPAGAQGQGSSMQLITYPTTDILFPCHQQTLAPVPVYNGLINIVTLNGS